MALVIDGAGDLTLIELGAQGAWDEQQVKETEAAGEESCVTSHGVPWPRFARQGECSGAWLHRRDGRINIGYQGSRSIRIRIFRIAFI